MSFNPQSLNRYSYAYNNPIVLKDLDGHWADEASEDYGQYDVDYGGPSNTDNYDSGGEGNSGGNIGTAPTEISFALEDCYREFYIESAYPQSVIDPNTTNPLGIYRDPDKPGIYKDAPVIYEDKQIVTHNLLYEGLKDGKGVLGAVGSGSAINGSEAITVFGNPETETPSSWQAYEWGETGVKDGPNGWDYTGWSAVSEDAALGLSVTHDAMDYFNNKK